MLIKFEEELNRVIAERAQELSSQRNGEPVEEASNWLTAEQEIMHELDSHSSEFFQEHEIQTVCEPVEISRRRVLGRSQLSGNRRTSMDNNKNGGGINTYGRRCIQYF